MATSVQPQLGYGDQNPAQIDQVNQWMRSQPWYQALIASFGQDPNNVHLSDDQKAQIVKAAQANGVVVDEGHNGQQIDNSGNFKPAGSSLGKDLLEGAGIAGLGLTGLGAFGIGPLAGLLGAGGAAADAGTAAADTGAFVGPTAAEAGLTDAGTALAESGEGFIGPTLDEAGSSVYGPTADAASSAASSGGSSTLSNIAKLLGGSKGLAGVGSAIGSAETAAGNNRLDQEKLGLQANQENISGQSAYEQELNARATLEEQQRQQALKDAYRNSYAQAPPASPYDPAGPQKFSPSYLADLNNLNTQATAKLANGPQYDTTNMPALPQYQPINPANVQGATNTAPGTLSKIGQWLGPGFSTVGAIANMFGG